MALDGGPLRLYDRVAQLFGLVEEATNAGDGQAELERAGTGCREQTGCTTSYDWYAGTVAAVSESEGTCLILFDDGELSSLSVRADHAYAR